ncbi:MAG TPA: hypothetical protein VJU85_05895 [Nitrososphaeraceae archaeon]|jgi:hypothetical protein|nr:hypothetical protein [Nitrososphaeraceae archaeon]
MPYRIKISNGIEEIEIESDHISDLDTIIRKVEQLKQLFREKSSVNLPPKSEEESYLGKS